MPASPKPDTAPLPARTRRAFWVALLAIPALFFALLEGGLRLAGYGGDTALFVEAAHGGVAYYAVNPGVVRRYFSDPDFGTYVSRDRFRVEKAPGTFRIFCLGASTTIGFPYMYNGAYSSLLRDRLYVRFPERRVEVVNVGVTAVTSHTVADLAREVVRYEPDLLIVYAGHNEFYGALGVGSSEFVDGRRWVVRLYLALQRSRVFLLLRDGLRALGGAVGEAGEPEGQQLMERLARDRAIPHGSPTYERAKAIFRANLEDVVETARAGGVPVLVSTLASNLAAQPPFVSLTTDGLAPDVEAHRAELEAAGREAEGRGAWAEAAEHYHRALALDEAPAAVHFRLGRSLAALGRYGEALAAYRRARDLDALRFRASTDFNEVVREVARERRVPLVDMEAAFAAASPHSIPGDSLFLEHVHPTFDGYLLMAGAFARAMAEHGLMAPPEAWAARPDSSDAFYRRFAGVTDLDHEVSRIRMTLLKNRWPFRDPPAPFEYEPETVLQQTALAYVRGEVGWAAAHQRLGQAYAQAGDTERGAEEAWAIAKVAAYDPGFALRAGDAAVSERRLDRAAERYAFALHIEDAPLTRVKLGVVYAEAGRYALTVEHLEHALSGGLTPQQRPQVHALLARSYLHLGDTARAEAQVARLRALAPQGPQPPGHPRR